MEDREWKIENRDHRSSILDDFNGLNGLNDLNASVAGPVIFRPAAQKDSATRRAKNRSFDYAQDGLGGGVLLYVDARRSSAPFDAAQGDRLGISTEISLTVRAELSRSMSGLKAFSVAGYGCSMPMENIRSRSWRE